MSEKLEKKWSGKSLNKNVFGSIMLYKLFFLVKTPWGILFSNFSIKSTLETEKQTLFHWGRGGGEEQEKVNEK